jgi:hypothetical protein
MDMQCEDRLAVGREYLGERRFWVNGASNKNSVLWGKYRDLCWVRFV